MAMFENFPYTDMHNLNLDWIIKIAKDFLDQYTHIQEIIQNGLDSLDEKTTEGLENLDTKAEELETLLNAWYDSHSSDIADQLSAALADMQNALTAAITTFNTNATTKGQEVIASIPQDYTELTKKVTAIGNTASAIGNELPVSGIQQPLVWLHAGDQIKIRVLTNTNPSGYLNFFISPYAENDPIVQYQVGDTGVKTFTAGKEGYLTTNAITGSYTATIEVITDYSDPVSQIQIMEDHDLAYNYGMELDETTNDFIYLKAGESLLIWVKTFSSSGPLNFFTKPYAANDPITQFSGAGIKKFTAIKDGYVGINMAFSGTYTGICYLLTHNPIILDITEDLTYPIILSDIPEIIIKGNNHIINLGTRIQYTESSGIKYGTYQYTPGDWIDKVFVSQTYPMINTSSGIERTYYPNVPLWMTAGRLPSTSAIQLTPVADVITVQNTPNSYTYDVSNTRFVVNCSMNGHLYLGSGLDNGIQIIRSKVIIDNISVVFARSSNVDIWNSYAELTAVQTGYSLTNAGIKSNEDYSMKQYYCQAMLNGRDGFSSNGTHFFLSKMAYAYGNHDDGISNHGDVNYGNWNQVEIIEDGTFEGNRKAGIASPVYGSWAEIKNCRCNGNLLYGIEIETNTQYPVAQRVYLYHNIIANTPVGIYNDKYNVTAIGTIFISVTTDTIGTITIY